MAAYAIQFRRGTTTQHNSFTGLLGEVTVDTDKKTLVVHDGATVGGFPLAREGAASTASSGTFTSNVAIGGTLSVTSTSTFNDDVTIIGDLGMTGHIIPSANVTYDLGSSTMMWRDAYIGPGSLYINGSKVLEDNSGTIRMSADTNQNIKVETLGTGALQLIGSNGIQVQGSLNSISGDIQIGDHIDMNGSLIKQVATPVSSGDAANKSYVDAQIVSEITGGTRAVSGTTGTFSSNVTIGGNLTINGTTTTVNTQTLSVADNIIDLNSDFTSGTPSENAGIRVLRGDEVAVQVRWNESLNQWQFTNNGSTYYAIPTSTGDLAEGTNLYWTSARGDANFATNLAAADTGDLAEGTNLYWTSARGDANFATNLAASTTDGLGEGSTNLYFTDARVASYLTTNSYATESYVNSVVAGKDQLSELSGSTDDVAEGSTNLYFTNARARNAISVSGDLSYDAATGVISTQGLASSTTGDLAEGSNLYFTDARARAAISVSGDLGYNSTTGVLSFTERTDAEVRGLISVSGDLSYNNGTGVLSVTTYKSSNFDTDFGNKSTDNLGEGSTNLYFTDARAQSAVSGNITSAVSAATTSLQSYADQAEADAISTAATDATSKADAALVDAKAYTDTRETAITTAYTSAIATAVAGKDNTDEITEGSTNLYFTDARARAAISVSGDLSYDSSTGVISTQGLASSTTTNLAEGSNLYFTDARAIAAVEGATLSSVTTSGNVTVGGTLNSDDITAATMTASGNVVIQGNLTVQGTTVTIDTQTIELQDNIILLNSNATGSATMNGGIEIERGDDINVQFVWDETNDRWTFASRDVYTTGTVSAGAVSATTVTANLVGDVTGDVTGDLVGNVTGTVSSLVNHDTDDLAEGSFNLYYTDERVDDRVASLLVAGNGIEVSYDDALNLLTLSAETAWLDNRYMTPDEDEYVNGVSFATTTGILTLNRRLGTDLTVDLDGRYLLVDDYVDNDTYLATHAFNSSTGVLTSTLNDATTVTVDLDGRYLLISDYVDNDTYLSSLGFDTATGILTATMSDSLEITVDLDGRYVESVSAGAGLSNSGTTAAVTLDVNVDRGLTIVSDNVGIADTGVTAGSYGAADSVTTFTVNSRGQLTAANNTSISIVASQVSDFDTAVKSALAMTHSAVYVISAAAASANSGLNPELTWTTLGFDLTGKDMYMVYMNRMLLRPDEYTVSSTGITFDQFLLTQDDEIEAVMLG